MYSLFLVLQQKCDCCDIRNLAAFPSSVNAPVQYGHQAKAFASLLNQQYLLPFEKVSDLFEDLFSQPINVRTIISGNKALYDALEVPEQEIKRAIEQNLLRPRCTRQCHGNGQNEKPSCNVHEGFSFLRDVNPPVYFTSCPSASYKTSDFFEPVFKSAS